MKKTKILVAMAAIIVGLGTTVYAELPKNPNGSIMVGNQVYSMDYIKSHIDLVNQQLMNNLNAIFYVDDKGNAKDMFSTANVSESQLISRVGTSLTNYDPAGNAVKYVAGPDNKYVNTNISEDANEGSAILDITYKNISQSTDMKLVSIKVRNVFGVKDVTYYTITEGAPNTSNILNINDGMTCLNSSSTGKRLTIYDSNKNAVMFGTFQFNFNIDSTAVTQTVRLQPTGYNPGQIVSTAGNYSGNIVNNGFTAVDEEKAWIYYSNSADKNKIYKRSVEGIEDYVISDDSAKYINVVGNWIYYSNYDDNCAIYKVRTDGTGRQKICDDMASCINVVGDSIYYINHSDGGKIYVIDSKGKRIVSGDKAEDLNVVGKSMFYSSISAGKRLYGIRLDDPSLAPVKLSEIPANCINAISETNIYYVSSDGKLYNNRNNIDANYPVTIVSNIAKKGGKNETLTSVEDKLSNIFVDKNGNIYYKSYADKNKLYRADIHGNGYKVTDDSVDYINLVNTDPNNAATNKGYVYYVKSNKLSRIPIDTDGSVKGEVIKKPKLNEKVSKIQPIPVITVDDLNKFNFPERVSAIMSDNSVRELVVTWDKSKPSIKNGIYTYNGSILGYGNKVTLQVALGSGMVEIKNVEIKNLPGKADYVKVSNLEPGDIIKVYDSEDSKAKPKLAKAGGNGIAVVNGLDLNPMGGSVIVTLTKQDKAEGGNLLVSYQAEAPSGFTIDAEKNDIIGLRPGSYIGYLYDATVMDDSKIDWKNSGDGKVTTSGKISPIIFNIEVQNDGKVTFGNGTTFADKVDKNNGRDLSFRIVKKGETEETNSELSETTRIGRTKVPNYVGIDYRSGAIMGTTMEMQYAYDTGDGTKVPEDPTQWQDCKSGMTPVMINSYMQVWVKIKANGPMLSSKARAFSLFAPPKLLGVNEGETYSKDKKPMPTWDTSNANIKAYVVEYDDNKEVLDLIKSPNLIKELDKVESGVKLNITDEKYKVDKIYAVVLQETKTANGRTGIATTVVKFRVNNATPSPADIAIKERKGTLNSNIDIYYQATPTWNNSIGTDTDVRLQRLELPNDIAGLKTDWAANKAGAQKYDLLNRWDSTKGDIDKYEGDGFKDAERVPIIQGIPIKQEGLYKLTVMVRNMETGAIVPNVKYFVIDRTPVTPAQIHMNAPDKDTVDDKGILANGGTYKQVRPLVKGSDKVEVSAEIMGINGAYVPVELNPKIGSERVASLININGTYTFKVTTTNSLNGATDETSSVVTFNVKNDSTTPIPDVPSVGLDYTGNKFTLINADSKVTDVRLMQYNVGTGWKDIVKADDLANTKFILPPEDVANMFKTKEIRIRVPAMGGSPESAPKIIVLKEQTEKPSGLGVTLSSPNTNNDEITIKFDKGDLASCEYSIDGGNEWLVPSSTGQKVDAKKLVQFGDILVRKKAKLDSGVIYAPSDVINMGLRVNKDVPSGIAFSFTDNKLVNVNDKMEYSLDGGVTWAEGAAADIDLTTRVSDIKPDKDILVRYKASGMFLPSAYTVIDIKEAPTAPSSGSIKLIATDKKITGLATKADNLEYQVAIDGTGYGDWKVLTVNDAGEATIIEDVNAGTSKIKIRVKGVNLTLPSESTEIIAE